MLKLRYLLLQGINPLPYVQDDFPKSVLKLLKKPYEEIHEMLNSTDLTYLSVIGLLDSENSKFLYDYLITLTPEQFNTESDNILNFIG